MVAQRHSVFMFMFALVRQAASQGWCTTTTTTTTAGSASSGSTCTPVVSGKCSGNFVSSTDVTCGTNKVLKSGSASITGTTVDACCDDVCSGFTCPSGYHYKSSYSSIVGNAQAACCDADITGKCSGNTASSSDVTCGTNKVLKSGSASITGTTDAACCDAACSGFTCPSGYHYKSGYASIAGNTQGACCDADVTNLCMGNTNSANDVVCSTQCTGTSCLASALNTTGLTKSTRGDVCSSCCAPAPSAKPGTSLANLQAFPSGIFLAGILMLLASCY